MGHWRRTPSRGVLAGLLVAAGCGDVVTFVEPTPRDDIALGTVISDIGTSDGVATITAGPRPPGVGGVVPTVDGTTEGLVPGSATLEVRSDVPFSSMTLAIDGVDGYWRVILPTSRNWEAIGLALPARDLGPILRVRVAVGEGEGIFGSYADAVIAVPTTPDADMQVSLRWDVVGDLDLHVVTPSGQEIYWDNTAADGGELVRDATADCGGPSENRETIVWQRDRVPIGNYTVRADYYGACGSPAVNFVVVVQVAGRVPRLFGGSFEGLGDLGGRDAGIEVVTFRFAR